MGHLTPRTGGFRVVRPEDTPWWMDGGRYSPLASAAMRAALELTLRKSGQPGEGAVWALASALRDLDESAARAFFTDVHRDLGWPDVPPGDAIAGLESVADREGFDKAEHLALKFVLAVAGRAVRDR